MEEKALEGIRIHRSLFGDKGYPAFNPIPVFKPRLRYTLYSSFFLSFFPFLYLTVFYLSTSPLKKKYTISILAKIEAFFTLETLLLLLFCIPEEVKG